MIKELNTVDKIARYYFGGVSLFTAFVAASCMKVGITFSIMCFALSFFHFFACMGLLQRKKWGLFIARVLAGIDVFKRSPFYEWLANLNDNSLDQYFR